MKMQNQLPDSFDPIIHSYPGQRRWSVVCHPTLTIGWLVFAAIAQAVAPPPDGGYANQNTAEGRQSLFSLTTGVGNTAVGFHALFTDTTGGFNTALGETALAANDTGSSNTACGSEALAANTTGVSNTAVGTGAMSNNTIGIFNTAVGVSALATNTEGASNTAIGLHALIANTTGNNNTASGYLALLDNTSGEANTATGVLALANNETGRSNTASGYDSMDANTAGSNNTASGYLALSANTTGSDNIALGLSAGSALTTGDANIAIGNTGMAGESGTIRIGSAGTHNATFVAGIVGTAIGPGLPVRINASGQLGTMPSSARFKEKIKPMQEASEALHKLKPVTFRYKHDLDPQRSLQFGLVAEQVEKVDPDLIVRDEEGRPFSVRYEAINAMLLNEFLKEHRVVERQKGALAELQAVTAKQEEQIKALTAALRNQAEQIQKVSASLAAVRASPRLALKE